MFGGGFLSSLAFGEAEPIVSQNFETTLQSAIDQFKNEQFGAANTAFIQLESIFGEEPEYKNPQVQENLLPLWGYAALLSQDFSAAIDQFQSFLGQFPGDSKRHAFVRFSLAQAFQAADQPEEAIETYFQFTQQFAETPESGIAQLRIAELYLRTEVHSKALDTLDQFYQSTSPLTLRLQARLRSLQIAVDQGLWSLAINCLLHTPWDLETLPIPYHLTLAALQTGDYLLNENRPQEAIAVYRLVLAKRPLIDLQRKRLASIQDHLERRTHSILSTNAGIWLEYYRSLASQLETLIQQLESSEDYTAAYFLRSAQAFTQAKRYYEAWVLYQSIFNDPSIDQASKEEALYREILCIQQLERWDDAITIAQSYVDTYPLAHNAPLVLYLIANALQQLHRPAEAVAILDQLINDYPNHSAVSRWIFTRGFNYLLLEIYPTARSDFSQYIERFPAQPLATNARLWNALTFFFEKDYPSALDHLNQLIKTTPEDHYLQAEMHYRRGAILYALRQYEPALEQIDSYLARFTQDHNRTEALVLRGDSLMGLGRLFEAALAFRQVEPGPVPLYTYAIFQIGKIYRAMEDYDRLAQHFSTYLNPTSFTISRISEALYWIGWAHEQKGQINEAFPFFLQALDQYGNDPQASEIPLIFNALQRLHQHYQKADVDDQNTSDNPSNELLDTPKFLGWITVQSEQALLKNRLTYYARLILYKIEHPHSAFSENARRQRLILLRSQVPPPYLDGHALGLIGMAQLHSHDPQATQTFHDLLHRYPKSPDSIYAWIGLGQLAFQAEKWTQVVEYLQPVVDRYLTHPLATPNALLYATALRQLGQPSAAETLLNDILKLKSARGKTHAEAIMQLAAIAEDRNEVNKAIACYQRVYNLYRAYSPLVVTAYFESARLFEKNGDLQAAFNTYVEMLHSADFETPEEEAQARNARDRLEPLVSNPNQTESNLSPKASS